MKKKHNECNLGVLEKKAEEVEGKIKPIRRIERQFRKAFSLPEVAPLNRVQKQ